MKHRRVRTDEFTTQSNLLRVTGRQGYEERTDVWITREMEVEFEQNKLETIDPGFNVLTTQDGNGDWSLQTLTRLNLNGTVDCKLDQGIVCKSLENVKIKPVGCTSFYDAYPKTQRTLLPYLVPQGTIERSAFLHSSKATFDEKSEVGPTVDYRWDTRVNGNFVMGFTEEATDPNSVG